MNHEPQNMWGIPALRSDRLATIIPTCTYAGAYDLSAKVYQAPVSRVLQRSHS